MNTEKNKELREKYVNGETTLNEEAQFFRSEEKEGELKLWAQYRQKTKRSTPENLQERLALSLDDEASGKKPRSKRVYWTLASAAASLLLIWGVFFRSGDSSEMSLSEKEAMLESVINMLPSEEEVGTEILYEDDFIVIYLGEEIN